MTQTTSQTRPPQGASTGRAQLDPNSKNNFDYTIYTLTATLTTGAPLTAKALSVGTTYGGYQSGKEYWHVSSTFLAAFANGSVTQLAFVANSYNWSTQPTPPSWGGSDQSPTIASRASWDVMTPQTPLSGTIYGGNKGIHLSGTPTAPVVNWYIRSTTAVATGTYAVDENGATFASPTPSAVTPPMNWYTAVPV